MTAALWLLGIVAVIGGSAYGLRKYVEHREFEAQEQGLIVGKAIGRLTDEELEAIIYGCPLPSHRPSGRRRWRRR